MSFLRRFAFDGLDQHLDQALPDFVNGLVDGGEGGWAYSAAITCANLDKGYNGFQNVLDLIIRLI